MSHDALVRYADDWHIVRRELFQISIAVGVGLEEYIFKSPSLRYKASFFLPKVSAGAEIGANFSSAVEAAAEMANAQLDRFRGGNDHWVIRRRFSVNSLVGGSVRLGTFGATVGPVDGSGATLKILDNDVDEVATYDGGSFGAGAGARINLGTAAIGVLIGPHNEVSH